MVNEIPIIYADDPNFEKLLSDGKIASGTDCWMHPKKREKKESEKDNRVFITELEKTK